MIHKNMFYNNMLENTEIELIGWNAFSMPPFKHCWIFDKTSVKDDMHSYLIVKVQLGQQFGCNEEILRLAGLGCLFDQHIEDFALVGRVHSLVDLVDTPEWYVRYLLQRKRINGNGDSSFPSGLYIPVERLYLFIVTILDANLNAIFLVVELQQLNCNFRGTYLDGNGPVLLTGSLWTSSTSPAKCIALMYREKFAFITFTVSKTSGCHFRCSSLMRLTSSSFSASKLAIMVRS